MVTGPPWSPTVNGICSSLPSSWGIDPVRCTIGLATCQLAVEMTFEGLIEPLDLRSGATPEQPSVPGHRRHFVELYEL
jgi:hypothetical protein